MTSNEKSVGCSKCMCKCVMEKLASTATYRVYRTVAQQFPGLFDETSETKKLVNSRDHWKYVDQEIQTVPQPDCSIVVSQQRASLALRTFSLRSGLDITHENHTALNNTVPASNSSVSDNYFDTLGLFHSYAMETPGTQLSIDKHVSRRIRHKRRHNIRRKRSYKNDSITLRTNDEKITDIYASSASLMPSSFSGCSVSSNLPLSIKQEYLMDTELPVNINQEYSTNLSSDEHEVPYIAKTYFELKNAKRDIGDIQNCFVNLADSRFDLSLYPTDHIREIWNASISQAQNDFLDESFDLSLENESATDQIVLSLEKNIQTVCNRKKRNLKLSFSQKSSSGLEDVSNVRPRHAKTESFDFMKHIRKSRRLATKNSCVDQLLQEEQERLEDIRLMFLSNISKPSDEYCFP